MKKSTVKKTQSTTPTAPAAPTAPATGQGGVSDPTKMPTVTNEPTLVPSTQAPGTKRPAKTKGPTPTPTVKPTPTTDPYVPEGKGWQKLDLSKWSGSTENYLETGGQIVLSKVELVSVPIPTNLEKIGDKIEVLIRGSVPAGSQGFRYWLVNDGARTMTTLGHYSNFGEGVEDPRKEEPQADLDAKAFKSGDFQVQRVLEHINKDQVDDIIATKLLLKAPVSGGTLDGTTITGIWVRYGDDIGKGSDVDNPPVESGKVESGQVESSDVTKSYTVDFAKDKIINTQGQPVKEVADGVTTFTMPQFTGFAYVLPEDKDSDAYKYITITYKSTGGMMVEMFDEKTNLSNPDISRGSTTKHVVYGDDKFPKADDWKVVTYAVTDEFHSTGEQGNDMGVYDFSKGSFKGIQLFNMGGEATLEIKSIVFSEKEPGSEDPGTGEEDPGVPWTAVDLSTADNGTFDNTAGTLAVKGVESLAFTLPSTLPADGKLEVKLVGTDNGGSLFRVWAGGYQNDRTSDVALHPGMFGSFASDGAGGDFSIICNLTLGADGVNIHGETNLLSLKGYASWNPEAITSSGKMDDIVFTSVSYRIVDEFTNK